MRTSNKTTNRPWWAIQRRGNASAIRILVIVGIAIGLGVYRSQKSAARKAELEARGGVMVSENNPELRRVREDARAHWNDFLNAFLARDTTKTGDDAPTFAVKAKFPVKGERNTNEFMWVEVVHVEGPTIKGTLPDEPISNIGFHKGDTVEVNSQSIEDWFYIDANGDPHGGESDEVLERARK